MKLDRVVVGIDFSERSIAAARWIARAFAPRAQLVLAHVLQISPPPRFLRSRSRWLPDDAETCRAGARVRLRQVGSQIGRGLIWEEVRMGRPDEEILSVAREYDADLLVVGSHRDRPGLWNRLGSTAERVLAAAPMPVLVVHGAPHAAPRSLLAAVDDSDLAGPVIDHARRLAARFDAGGRVVHVLPEHAIQRLLLPGEVTAFDHRLIEAEQQLVLAAHDWLAGQLADAEGEGLLAPGVLLGDAAEAVLAEAVRVGAELLIMGRERGGRIQRCLLGSVSGAAIRGARCPVLVLPATAASVSPVFDSQRDARDEELSLAGIPIAESRVPSPEHRHSHDDDSRERDA